MPVKPDSRFATQPILRAVDPDGHPTDVIGLRIRRPELSEQIRHHRVTEGDSIDLLAKEYYGDEQLWWRILDANPLMHPWDLRAGDLLTIPAPGPSTQVNRARTF